MLKSKGHRRSFDCGEGVVPEAGSSSRLSDFAKDSTAAVAALFAIGLFVLVAAAGVAWDWTRMTAMDSELQNAADQAALAAATQLDGEADAIARATNAASNLVANISRMSNDGEGAALTVQTITFYDGYDQADDEFGDVTDVDAEAGAVRVQIAPREAIYTLTPIVGVMRSGDITAEAAAALGSAICNTPPVMICNPFEGDDANENWDANDYIGVGLKLITDDAGAPGNFGFLRNGLGTGAQDLARALGYNNQPGECVPGQGVETEPGLKDVVFNALNTRFDISTNGANTCPNGGTCSAAPIVRKDLVKGNGNGSCGTSGNNSWDQPIAGERYAPSSAAALNEAERAAVAAMGLPRDLCHAWSEDGDCAAGSGVVGTGNWDRDAYFEVNFGYDHAGWRSALGLGAGDPDPSRYQVYQWEAGPPARAGSAVGSDGKSGHYAPVCRATGGAERRLITAAVINCDAESVTGHQTNVRVQQWVEFFLVEPSFNRDNNAGTKITDANDVYVEVVRAVDVGDDGESSTVVRRDIPYLIR